MSQQIVKVEISIKSLLLVIATLVSLWVALLLKDIIITIFIAFILTAAIEPLAIHLKRFRVPQVISLFFAYVAIAGLFVALFFMLAPPLITQVDALVRNLPTYTAQAIDALVGQGIDEDQINQSMQAATDFLTDRAEILSGSVLQIGLGLVSGLFALITVIVVSFYILIEKARLYEGLSLTIGQTRYQTIKPIIEKIENRLGSWVRGQLLLGLIIGLITWIGLSLLQIPYALPLAIIAGILELVPLIGPIIAAIPAIVVALTISPAVAIATSIFYVVVQQLESNLIVPKVMQKAVGLNPFFVLVAILAGAALMGIMGALLAIPVAVVIVTILEHFNNQSSAIAAIETHVESPVKKTPTKSK